jgi:hypothetical protein
MTILDREETTTPTRAPAEARDQTALERDLAATLESALAAIPRDVPTETISNQEENVMERTTANLDPQALAQALSNARLHLEDALGRIQDGGATGATMAGRLRALEDQNTGCQNSGCGGGLAARTLPTLTQRGGG